MGLGVGFKMVFLNDLERLKFRVNIVQVLNNWILSLFRRPESTYFLPAFLVRKGKAMRPSEETTYRLNNP